MGARKKKGRKQKNRAYYMRFAPKMRRRRQAKTDYQARSLLIRQDKNKYNTPKFRFVVRITNKDVCCQVVSSKIIGDEVLCAAYSHELKRYGLEVGLTNWSACYATGLLLARRLLTKIGMADYEGVAGDEVNGEHFLEEADYGDDDPKEPFTCYLDVGLRRTTTGSRVFAAMKGATDGGVVIPHRDNGKQFPGYTFDTDAKSAKFDADVCRNYIFGNHVADYMRKLEEDNADKYSQHFSQYIAKGISADDLEGLYSKVHAAIRANPQGPAKKDRDTAQVSKFKNQRKKTAAERRDRVLNKILSRRKKATTAV
jgi:large subunit ribosomal protein L5e